MSKYHDILYLIYKLENIIARNKSPTFESLVWYKSAGELIKANDEDEIISILQDKIKRVLGISTSNLEDTFAAIGDDSTKCLLTKYLYQLKDIADNGNSIWHGWAHFCC